MLDTPAAAPYAGGVNDPDAVERPERGPENIATYGSDCVAEVIRALGIPYVVRPVLHARSPPGQRHRPLRPGHGDRY